MSTCNEDPLEKWIKVDILASSSCPFEYIFGSIGMEHQANAFPAL
jgi:hypothetical protein